MRHFLYGILLTFVMAGRVRPAEAQMVRKMTIPELQAYIAQCDHPLIVNFWATYCQPCIKEIPYMEATVDKYKKDRVELMLVSLDLPDYYPSKISAFVEKGGYHGSIVWLNETNADYFCPKIDKRWSGGIPASLLVNNKMNYRRFFDRQLTDLQVEQEVKRLVVGAN